MVAGYAKPRLQVFVQPLIGVLIACLPLWVFAQTPQWQWETGVYGSDGEYGKREPTQILYVPVTLRWRAQDWQLSLSTGWARIDGPGHLEGGAGRLDQSSERRDGVADTLLQVRYYWPVWRTQRLYTDTSVKVKLPTARAEDGLGTGKTDVELEARAYWWLGKLSPYGRLAYRWRQQPTFDSYQVRDYGRLTIGAHYPAAAQWDVLGQLEGRSRTSLSGEDALDAVLLVRWKVSQRYSLSTYVTRGLATGSPDWAAGMLQALRF